MTTLLDPKTWVDGGPLAARDLNEYLRALEAQVRDVARRRYRRGTLTFPFVRSCQDGYTRATDKEVRTYRFKAPVQVVVERSFLVANLTSSGPVYVTVADTNGDPPQGAVTPLLSTREASADPSVTIEDFSGERLLLEANTEYLFTVTADGINTFETERFDVTLHLLVDRWNLDGAESAPAFEPFVSEYRATTPRSGNFLALSQAALEAAAGELADNVSAPLCALYQVHDLAGAASQSFLVPQLASGRAVSTVPVFYFWAQWNGAADSFARAYLRDEAAVAQGTAEAPSGSDFGSDRSFPGSSLVDAASDASVDSAKDWAVEIENLASQTLLKGYALVWFDDA